MTERQAVKEALAEWDLAVQVMEANLASGMTRHEIPFDSVYFNQASRVHGAFWKAIRFSPERPCTVARGF